MSNRTIASRGRLRGAAIALSALGVMAFAPSALATTYNVTNTATLVSAISSANTAGGSNVINLAADGTNGLYSPTAPITIAAGDNLEITGNNPKAQASSTQSTQTVLTGANITPLTTNAITVAPGASLFLKGFSVTAGGQQGSSVTIEDNGNVVLDNMDFYGDNSTMVSIDQTGSTVPSATIDNSFMGNSAVDAVENNAGNLTMNNDDVIGNAINGVILGGNSDVLANTLIAENNGPNCQGTATSVSHVIDDDATCGGTTVSSDTALALPRNLLLAFNGGPTSSLALGTGSVAIGAGSGCLPIDQRFFKSGSSCDVGSYQTAGTSLASYTTGPICAIGPIHEASSSSDTSTEIVNVTDPSGPGLGLDSVITPSFLQGSGTFAVGTLPTSVSGGPVAVEAKKLEGDQVTGDTKWEFTVTDFMGNSSLCK